MVRLRSFALAIAGLLLAVGISPGGPPGTFGPPSYYHYPSARDNVSPARRTTSNYFAPPQSYYLHPSRAEPGYTPQYVNPSSPPSFADIVGEDVRLVPRVLREATPEASAVIQVRVPADAELWFNGAKTEQTGTLRTFESPPLEVGTRYAYDVKARWTEGGKAVEKTFHVPLTAGTRTAVNFTK
jgi:uncharacterized protein (TIGR03000 family)